MNAKLASLTIAISFLTLSLSTTPAAAATTTCAGGAVRIDHTYATQQGATRIVSTTHSLGTAVGAHVVLTHNHFARQPQPGQGETLTFVECSGKTTRLAVERLAFVAVDAGTALIYLPDDVALTSASTADPKVVTSVAAGARLQVSYWDDGAGRFAQKEFAVIKVKNGVATLADPDRTINSGDSGGGVFLNSALVADTWAIYQDAQGQATGKFDVALLPADAQRLLAAPAEAHGSAQ